MYDKLYKCSVSCVCIHLSSFHYDQPALCGAGVLLAGLDLDKYRRFLFRGRLHLLLEGAGAPVGSQDVLQLLLLRLHGDHLLLQAPILQLPVVNLHLESLYLIKSSSTFLLFALPMRSPLLQSGVTTVVEPDIWEVFLSHHHQYLSVTSSHNNPRNSTISSLLYCRVSTPTNQQALLDLLDLVTIIARQNEIA